MINSLIPCNNDIEKIKISTSYYDNHKKLVEAYDTFLYSNDSTDLSEINNIVREESKKLSIQSTYVFFKSNHSSWKSEAERLEFDRSIGKHSHNIDYRLKFNINRYNYEKIVKLVKLKKIDLDKIKNLDYSDINLQTLGNMKLGCILMRNNKYSNIALVKHNYSLEFYDFVNHRTVAYKNYRQNKTFGAWNNEYEDLALRVVKQCIIKNTNSARLNNIKNDVGNDKYKLIVDVFKKYFNSYFNDYVYDILEVVSILIGDTERCANERIKLGINKKYLCNTTENAKSTISVAITILSKYNIALAEVANAVKHENNLHKKQLDEERYKKEVIPKIIYILNNRYGNLTRDYLMNNEKFLDIMKKQFLGKNDIASEKLRLIVEKTIKHLSSLDPEIDRKIKIDIYGIKRSEVLRRAKELEEERIRREEEAEKQRREKIIRYETNWRDYEIEHQNLVSGLGYNFYLPSKESYCDRVLQMGVNLCSAKLLKATKSDKFKSIDLSDFASDKIIYYNRKSNDIDYEKLMELVEAGDRLGLDKYLSSLLGKYFVRLVRNNKMDINNNEHLIKVYEHFYGKKYRPRGTKGKTAEVRRIPKNRDLLMLYDGTIIHNINELDQSSAELFITEEAFRDLSVLIYNSMTEPTSRKLTSSDVNTYIEDYILYPKSQRIDFITLDKDAVIAYVTKRDTRDFKYLDTLYSDNKTKPKVYLPGTYKFYLEGLNNANKHNSLINGTLKCILNILIYEHLYNVCNKAKPY